MLSQFFFISSRHIVCFPSEQLDQPIIEAIPANGDFIQCFTSLLNTIALKNNTVIGIAVDSAYSLYQHISLPYIKSRKLSRLVEYEIEDHRLNMDLDYINSIYSESDKAKTSTEVGVYSILQSQVNDIIQLSKDNHLELKWITPFSNLLDVQIRQHHHPHNDIWVFIDEPTKTAWFQVYRFGFLISISTLSLPSGSSDLIKSVNQKLATIYLSAANPYDLRLDDTAQNFYTIDDNLQLEIKDVSRAPENQGQLPLFMERAVTSANLKRPQIVNLLKSNHLVVQEIKKNAVGFILAMVFIGLTTLIYLFSVGYGTIRDNQQRVYLTQILDDAISKYLPKGSPKTNAERVLRDTLNETKQKREENKKYELRNYPVSAALAELSSLKADIPSFHLNRFTMNDQAIRFQGTVDSIGEFERLRETLPTLYPSEAFAVTFNQKNRGGDIVEFSISAQPIR